MLSPSAVFVNQPVETLSRFVCPVKQELFSSVYYLLLKNASDILSSIPPMLFMCVSMQIKLFLFFFITITSSLSFSSSSRISVIFFWQLFVSPRQKFRRKKPNKLFRLVISFVVWQPLFFFLHFYHVISYFPISFYSF